MIDPVKRPSHYIRGGLECIDVIKAVVQGLDPFEAYCIGNVIKYCWRWKQKNGLEDIQKAKQYLEFLEEYLGVGYDAAHKREIHQDQGNRT